MHTLLWISAVLVLCASANAGVITSHLTSRAQMDALLGAPAFIAEGRIGDRSARGEFELSILADDPDLPAANAHFNWQRDRDVAFRVSYDETANLVSFVVGQQGLTYSPMRSFSDVFIQTQSSRADSSILVDQLILNGEAVLDQSSAIANSSAFDVLHLSGGELADGFELTGAVRMSWRSGNRPTGSELAYQVVFGIPEPTALALLLAGVLFLGRCNRRCA